MTIRTRITLVAVAVVLAVSAMLYLFGHRAQMAAERRYVESVVSGKRLLWDQIAARIQEQMAMQSKALTRDSVMMNALRKDRLETVREQAATTHNSLSGEGTLERLQIFDTQGNYIAALPDAMSGMTRKGLVRRVIDEGKMAQGINRDDDGQLQVITAFPLFVRGQLSAVAVYSKGVQVLIDRLQATDGSDVLVFDPAGGLEARAAENAVDSTPRPELNGPEAARSGAMMVDHQAGHYRVIVGVPIVDDSGQVIAEFVTSQDQTETYRVQANAAYLSVALVALLLIVSAGGLSWYFHRTFRPIDQAVTNMRAIAEGHLDLALPEVRGNDEIARLTGSMRTMVEQLRALIGQITTNTGGVIDATDRLNALAEQGSRRLATQRGETDQVATATNEMSATIHEIANSAAKAADAATRATGQTQIGNQALATTISAINALVEDVQSTASVIERLRSESEGIGGVLDVIRSIAEQTNLLALNAAIEAARAGEQGRGFAVVADEVRTLASRTQQSTHDIQAMIEKLQQGAEDAVRVMGKGRESSSKTLEHASSANAALSEITGSVEEINAMNAQIARAAEEQSTVSELISRSVSQIATLAEESTSDAGHTARAAADIAEKSHALGGLVSRFSL